MIDISATTLQLESGLTDLCTTKNINGISLPYQVYSSTSVEGDKNYRIYESGSGVIFSSSQIDPVINFIKVQKELAHEDS